MPKHQRPKNVHPYSTHRKPNSEHPKAEPFPIDLLPDVVRRYVSEGAESRAADPSIVALPVLITLAASIGLTRKIAPKRAWEAPAILWGAVVARSGSVKSVGYDLALELLKPFEDAEYQAHEIAMRSYKIDDAKHRKAAAGWEKSKKADAPPEAPARPIAKRMVVDDQTVEGLAPLLAENPRGLFLLCDELRGFLESMGAYSSSKGGGRDEARWLTLFDGRPFNVDRKTGRSRIYIPRAGSSVFGTIQPGTLRAAVGKGQVESGFLARMLLVAPDPRAKVWTDAEMSEVTRLAMVEVVSRLKSLEHESIDELPSPIVLPLTEDAKQRFIRFVNTHGQETVRQDDALAAAWSKLEGYALRLALVDHLVRWASGDEACSDCGPVGIVSIESGIELARWFGTEAERAYRLICVSKASDGDADAGNRDVERLREWLQSKGGSATERDIKRGPRRYRENGDLVERDCRTLIKSGRAKWDSGNRTRRIVLVEQTPYGDGDSIDLAHEETGEVPPTASESSTSETESTTTLDCDASTVNTASYAKVSPSPREPSRMEFTL